MKNAIEVEPIAAYHIDDAVACQQQENPWTAQDIRDAVTRHKVVSVANCNGRICGVFSAAPEGSRMAVRLFAGEPNARGPMLNRLEGMVSRSKSLDSVVAYLQDGDWETICFFQSRGYSASLEKGVDKPDIWRMEKA